MQWDQKKLERVERMAGAAFTHAEIAEVLSIEEYSLQMEMQSQDSPYRKAYRTGLLARQLELRERIFKDAANGSSPAQTLAHKLLEDVIIKESL